MKITQILSCALSVTLTAFPVYAGTSEDLPEVHKIGSISYITGGIGDEERDAMHDVKSNYNLRVLSAETTGAYSGDTHIQIYDKKGNELVNADADPIFYANLPQGKYKIEESSDGQTKKQTVVISKNKPVNIAFRWK